jgi:hypothetical protein
MLTPQYPTSLSCTYPKSHFRSHHREDGVVALCVVAPIAGGRLDRLVLTVGRSAAVSEPPHRRGCRGRYCGQMPRRCC